MSNTAIQTWPLPLWTFKEDELGITELYLKQ